MSDVSSDVVLHAASHLHLLSRIWLLFPGTCPSRFLGQRARRARATLPQLQAAVTPHLFLQWRCAHRRRKLPRSVSALTPHLPPAHTRRDGACHVNSSRKALAQQRADALVSLKRKGKFRKKCEIQGAGAGPISGGRGVGTGARCVARRSAVAPRQSLGPPAPCRPRLAPFCR